MNVIINVQITSPKGREENLSKIIELLFTPWKEMMIELKLDSLKLDIREKVKEIKLKLERDKEPILCLEMEKSEQSDELEYDAIVEGCKKDGWTVTK